MNFFSKSVAALSLLAAGVSAQAGVIDLYGLLGNFNQTTFGSSGSQYYAQSITADGTQFDSLRFTVNDAEGGSFKLRILSGVAAGLTGTGEAPDATHQLFSQTLNHTGGGALDFNVNLNLAVNDGEVLFFVLDAVNETLSGASVLATAFGGVDKYTGGEFIFANTNAALGTFGWSSRFGDGEDLVFRAAFSEGNVVPEPGSLALVAASLLGVCAARRRRV